MTDHAPERLRALGQRPPEGLDDAARERIVARVRVEGPELVRRARRTQLVTWVGATSVLALAAAALLVWVTRSPTSEPPVAERPAADRRAPGPAPLDQNRAAAPSERRCDAFSAPVEHRSAPDADGRVLITLGALATVATATPTAVRVEQPSACATLVTLAVGGVVAVHARDLGGGELRVRTPAGDAVVHGTIFEVRAVASGTQLDVVEGVVGVERDGRELARVAAGGRVSWRTGSVVVESALLAGPDRDAIVARLDPAVLAVPAPAVGRRPPARSADEILFAAERARVAGQLDDARRLYRDAAALGGPVGESAWIKLARFEQRLGRVDPARRALAARAAQFPNGALEPEATFLEHQLAERAGDARGARTAAQQLVARWPTSPYAVYARRWLRTNPEGSR